MTDKPIYLDGVDVSKCRYFLKDTEGQDYDTDEFVKGCCEAKGSCIGYEFAGYGLCRGDKDCYFKQLARKTQECERSQKRISDLEERIINHSKEIEEYCIRLANKNKKCEKYEQTLTEIKEIAEIEIECKTYEIENDCFNETRCKALNEHIDFIKQILQKISDLEV